MDVVIALSLIMLNASATGFILPPNAGQEIPECMLHVKKTGRFGPIPEKPPLMGKKLTEAQAPEQWMEMIEQQHGVPSAILTTSCPNVPVVVVYATDASAVDSFRMNAGPPPELPCDLDPSTKRIAVSSYMKRNPPTGFARYVVLTRTNKGLAQYTLVYNWSQMMSSLWKQAGISDCNISVGDGTPPLPGNR